MAGYGSRFRQAGYGTYKPFIEIHGKTMIQHVLDAFPPDVTKTVIVNPELLTTEQKKSLVDQPDVKVIEIAGHKDGPAQTLYAIADTLCSDTGYFIAYCDIFWTWDFEQVRQKLDSDGVIFTRQDFHPHLVNNNFSAFCLPQEDDANLVAKIQEKSSFTDDWLQEPLSVGTFYFKSGANLASALQVQQNQGERVAGEFFPSVLFNQLIADQKKVAMHDVDFFIHWGVPDQLNDYLNWSRVTSAFLNKELGASQGSFANVCCMGGLGSRMKKIDNRPKALLPVDHAPMFETVAKSFHAKHNVALTVEAVYPEVKQSSAFSEIINLGEQTKSQVETLERALPVLREQRNFLLTSCDAMGFYSQKKLESIIAGSEFDAVIFSFSPSLLQKKLKGQHSHVSAEGNRVKAVHVKNKTSENDLGLAGFFWFRDGRIFEKLDSINVKENREAIADDLLAAIVNEGTPVAHILLDHYIHLGTVEEYLEFNFWYDFAHKKETRLHRKFNDALFDL